MNRDSFVAIKKARSLRHSPFKGVSEAKLSASKKVRGAFNKFPAFFVLAFKIVVYSSKVSILLLYILWEDWPIVVIAGLNEQLQ